MMRRKEMIFEKEMKSWKGNNSTSVSCIGIGLLPL
jgi:hypothetical protein